jgi:hypothetical protein
MKYEVTKFDSNLRTNSVGQRRTNTENLCEISGSEPRFAPGNFPVRRTVIIAVPRRFFGGWWVVGGGGDGGYCTVQTFVI